MNFVKSDPSSSKLQNSDILKDLDQKVSHLDSDKRLELKQLILEYEHLFPDIPSRTDKIYHGVDIIDGSNIKSEMRSFKSNENIHKKEGGLYYVVSANKASSVTL